MRVALVIPTFNYTALYPSYLAMCDFPVGFAYIAAALKKAGHEVIGLNPNNCPGHSSARAMLYDKLKQLLAEQRPELIGIGGLCTDYPFIKDAIEIVRGLAPKVPIVCGGGIITHDSEFIFNLLRPDYCIIGEAEEVLIKLIESLETGKPFLERIPNLGYWCEGVARFTAPNFDYAPIETRAFPDYSPFDSETMIANSSVAARSAYRYTRPYPRIMPFVAARGCPFRCTFCVHHKGPKYRARPMSAIIEEITWCYETYRFNILMILDELFAIDRKRLQEFCDCILDGRRNFGWDFDWAFQTHANANLGRHELQKAKAAGCYLFSYGLESSSPRVLASMNKKSRPEQISEAITLATDVGVGFGGCYIFGDVAETPDTLTETMDFFQKHCMDEHVYFQPISPYPGSKLFDQCLQQGTIKDKQSYYEKIDTVLYNMTSMPDNRWFEWINSVIRPLNTMPHVITVEPSEVIRDRSPRDDSGTAPLWLITARCPHCKVSRLFREPLHEKVVASGNAAFLTGCASCGKRFKIAAKGEGRYQGEFAQRSISPQDLKSVIQNSIFALAAPMHATPKATSSVRESSDKSVDSENGSKADKLRVLFIQHELLSWDRARMWGYEWHLGLEEGFKANNVEFFTLTTTWFPAAKELISGMKFDQVWINDITHMFEPGGCGGVQLSEKDLEWLASLAPVRLGCVIESLSYSAEQHASNPALCYARQTLQTTAKYMTHIIVPDEEDIDYVRSICNANVEWFIGPVPLRFINQKITLPDADPPVFRGTPYGERAEWLAADELRNLISIKPSLDNHKELPALFNTLHGDLYRKSLDAKAEVNVLYLNYIASLRKIRQMAFELFLASMLEGCAVVNLPSYASIYTARVCEGMAAGRPVIASGITGYRERMRSCFLDGQDILLYERSNRRSLANQIKRILGDREFGMQLAMNARDKMIMHHTSEHRVTQILGWIRTGREIIYSGAAASGTLTADTPSPVQLQQQPVYEASAATARQPRDGEPPIVIHPRGKNKLRILLISPPYARLLGLGNCRFPLSFGSMASILSMNGHAVAIYDADFDKDLIGKSESYEHSFTNQRRIGEALNNRRHYVWKEIEQQVRNFKPNVVGITTMTSKFPMAIRVAAIAKTLDPDIQVVIGGHHSSIFGQKLIQDRNIDFAVIGEGEITFLELVNRMCDPHPDYARVNGLAYKSGGRVVVNEPRELLPNLDVLPIADRDLIINDGFVTENNIMTSRGCPFNCSYCGAQVIWKRKVRRRSVQNVVREIEYLFRRSPSRQINFWDDSFTSDRKYTEEMTDALKKFNGLRFSCITRLDLIEQKTLVQLKDAGCSMILFGVESGNDDILRLIDKKMTRELIKQKTGMVDAIGIPWLGFFIMGYPGETRENILQSLDFMKELNPSYAEINIFNPLPGTRVWNELEQQGKVSSDMDFSKFSQASTENFFTNGTMTRAEFKELALFMAREFDTHNRSRNGNG